MQAELIRMGGEIVNLNAIARVLWKDQTLWINTSNGFIRLQGREANVVWAMLEERVRFDSRTGEVKDPQR